MKNFAKESFVALDILAAVLVVAGLTVLGQSASADGAGNPEIFPPDPDVPPQPNSCMQDVAGFNLNCNANDVRVADALDIVITDDGCATGDPEETVSFTALFQVDVGAKERHDIGIWFSTDGDLNGDAARTGTCTVATPAYDDDDDPSTASSAWLDLDGTTDPFPGTNDPSNIQDTCGDIDTAHNPLLPRIKLTVKCIDPDGDGFLNLPNCTSWRIPGANELCTSPIGAFPGSPSKCRCDVGFNIDIPVPQTGTIEVVKSLDPSDDTGTFDLLIDGVVKAEDVGDTGTTRPVTVGAGTDLSQGADHTVAETAGDGTLVDPAVYDSEYDCAETINGQTGLSGDGSGPVTVTVNPDDAWACTFTNTLRTGTLTLVKTVVNDNGGTLDVSDFPLFMNGNSVTSGAAETFVNGTSVTASETQQTGYTASTWGGHCARDGTVTIEAGVDKTCTITNDDDAASLTLVKEVTNDNGGTAVPGDWTLTAAGYDSASPDAGTYPLSESGPDGYTLSSLTCDNATGQVTSATLGLGEDVTCTFVNDDDAPSLTLLKSVTNDNGGTAVSGDWTLTAAGYSAALPQIGSYDLSESGGPAGYTQTSLTCDNATGQVTSATLGLGEDVTCTFVNDDDAPSLTLLKSVTNDNGGTAVSGDWTLTAAGYSAALPQIGSYDLSESGGPAGYTQTSLTCDNATGQVTSATLGLGEDVTCTFVNDDDAPSLTLLKSVTNDNGGTAVSGDWTLTAAGYSAALPQIGSYDLSESGGPAGYTQTSLTCDNATGQVTSATLGLGEDVTCTFVNDDDAPSLTLLKSVTNDNGGTAVSGDWTLTAAGYSAALPQIGSYDLSESGGPAGYTQTSLTCDNATGQVTSATLGLGEDVTCTFVNDDDAPSLTLLKSVTNDNGGTAVSGDWTLTAAGYSAALPQIGSYDLSESGGPAGYTQTSLTCDNATGQVTSATLGLGEDVTCTFVNDDDAPSLTLLKSVTNDNGGTAVSGDWTLTAAGYSAALPQIGSYDLSESGGPAGYTQTSLTCDNATGQVTSATLGLGEDVTCTFVNDDDAPSLTLLKQVIKDNGGTAVPGDWTLTAAGYSAALPQIGSYDLSESGGPAGYTQTSLTCDNATGQVTSATLGLGEDVTCTFVNDDDAPSLTLLKSVTNDNGGTAVSGDWTLTAAGYSAALPQIGSYDLSESGGPAGYTQTSLTCDNATGQVTSATLGLGEDVTCTFVNDDDAPSLTLLKSVTNDNGGTAVSGDWTLTAAGYSAALPQIGSYDLSESGGPAGYTQTSLTCDNATGQVTSATLGLGEDVTCTFVNDDDAPSLTLLKQVIKDNGGTAVPGDWTLTAAGYDPVSPDAGTYNLSESGGKVGEAYTQTSLTCDNATGQVTSATLGLGEDVTCTFVNDDIPPQLIIEKTPDDFTIEPGDTATFTIVVTNIGGGPALGVTLDDTLPSPNTTLAPLVWLTSTAGCSVAGDGVTLACTIGDLALDPTPGNDPPNGDEASFTVTVSTTIPSDYLAPAGTPGGPGSLGSTFEIEGNLVVDDASVTVDWECGEANGVPCTLNGFTNQPDVPQGQNDDSFGKGSKENTPIPSVVDGSIPKNKSDLHNFLFNEEEVDGNVFMELGWLRANTLGTSNFDFELNQNQPDPLFGNGITPERLIGDILITFDFAGGGSVVDLGLRTWDGSAWANPIDLDASGFAVGAVNDPATFGTTPDGELNPFAGQLLLDNTFGEAVVNLTQAFASVGGTCRSFAAAYVKSRSSTSFTAALKDFIIPIDVDIDTCQTISLPNTATASATNHANVSDDGLIKVTNDPED